jgi:transaldolase
MALRLLLDSADPDAWDQWLPLKLFHGVTTNPTLLRRAGQPCSIDNLKELTQRALAHGVKELHLQAWGADLLTCGRVLADLAPERIWVKLPITRAGLEAAQLLQQDGYRITFTACYEPHQVLSAAALGVDYIAPYLGRISDLGRDGHGEILSMQRALTALGSTTRLLVASLRHVSDLSRLASEGVDTFTISAALAQDLIEVEATEAAALQFELDAAGA